MCCSIFSFVCLGQNIPAQQNNIRYCIDPDWAPYESIINGEHIGISKQYLNLIAKYSDFSFVLYPTNTWQESLDALAKGACQLLPMLNESQERRKTFEFSQIYFRASNVLYGRQDKSLLAGFSSLHNERVAVVNGYRLHHYLKQHFPKLSIKTVPTELAGLTDLSEGRVDLFVGSFYSSNLLIHELKLTDIRIVGIAEIEDKLRVGVNKATVDILPQINAAIDQFTIDDHRKVFTHLQRPVVVSETDYALAFQIGGISLLIAIILTLKHYKSLKRQRTLSIQNYALERLKTTLENKNKQLADLSVKDHLTGLYNRLYLNEQIDVNIRLKTRYKTPCCMMLIDIDDFKLFNDKYGHKVGDEVLKSVANTLKLVSRETDICARWGGEEFVILCPETNLHDAQILAERFLVALKTNEQLANNVTCSIGVAELTEGETESGWFNQADKAMYEAKAKGKNCIHTETQ